jgi:hypothetical protein
MTGREWRSTPQPATRRRNTIGYWMYIVLVVAVIMTLFTSPGLFLQSWFLVLVLTMPLWLPYIAAPIRVHARNWSSDRPDIGPVDPQGPTVPIEVRKLLNSVVFDLNILGFELLGFGSVQNASPSALMSYFASFQDPRTADRVRFHVTHLQRVKAVHLLFLTVYEDGTHFLTTDAAGPSIIPQPRNRKGSLAFPQVKTSACLQKIHEVRVDRAGAVRARIADPIADVREFMAAQQETFVDMGYYYRDPAEGRLWPTWEGAILMSWRMLWPVKQIRDMVRWRRAEKELRRLGIDPEEALR